LIDKTQTWQLVKNAGLLIERFGTEAIVYNPLSGETHQMNDFSVSVLEQMLEKHFTVNSLTGEVCSSFELENNTEIKNILTQLLNNFDQIGLIEPCY